MNHDSPLAVPALPVITLPRTALEFQLARIWEEVLGRRGIGIEDDFFQSGGDSLSAMTLLVRVAQETRYTLPAGGIFQAPTIEKLARLLREQAEPDQWSPLVAIKPTGSRPPFFCVHPGGGNILCYVQLSQRLDAEQPFYGLQAAGVDGTREPLTSVEEMAGSYIAAIRQVQPRGPYLVGGWSVGGVVAYEIAQQLVRAGEQVPTVTVLDSGILYTQALLTAMFSENGVRGLEVLRQPFSVQLAMFRRLSAAACLIPPTADDQIATRIYQIFLANMRAILEYRPRPWNGRLDLLQAVDPMVKTRLEPYREWLSLATRVELHRVPGNHLTMVQSPHVEATARTLQRVLREATSDECLSGGPRRPR